MTALDLPRASTVDEVTAAVAYLRSTETNENGAAQPVIVFTNGVFDLPHPGHIRSLRAASQLGDVLIVGINSDASVRRLKGPDRPIIPAVERAKILAAFEMVNFVIVFDEDTPLKVVQAIQPDVIAKGAEYHNREVVGADVVMAHGGRVEFLPMEDGISSTTIVDRIVRANK